MEEKMCKIDSSNLNVYQVNANSIKHWIHLTQLMVFFFACCLAFIENDSGLIDWPAINHLINDAYIKAKNYGTNKYHNCELNYSKICSQFSKT